MGQFEVDLPGGGKLELQTADEVDLWNNSAKRYVEDYSIAKQNDKVLLGALLTQGLVMYRAQGQLSQASKMAEAQNRISKAADQIRELERALGIDKKGREQGGQHTVASYVEGLKRAAHEKGIHIAARVKAYEALAMELRWRIRLLRNGDAEDRRQHGISEESIVNWAEEQLAELEAKDKTWAREKGAVFLGRV